MNTAWQHAKTTVSVQTRGADSGSARSLNSLDVRRGEERALQQNRGLIALFSDDVVFHFSTF